MVLAKVLQERKVTCIYIYLRTNFFASSDGMEKIQVTNKPLVARWLVPPKKSAIPRLWVASTIE